MHRIIKQLAQESYTNGELDKKKVDLIASKLQRSQLKEYAKALKEEERKNHVIITTAQVLPAHDEEELRKLFPQKKVVFQLDPSIIGGIQIMDNDVIYERSISQVFNDLAFYLTSYDR